MPAANPPTIKVIKQVPRREIAFAVAVKPHAGRIFFGGSDFTVWQIDLNHAKPEAEELGRHASYVTGVALAGNTLVSGGYDGRLIWWNIDSRSQIREVSAHGKWIRRVVAAPDGSAVASVADDMVCRVWDVESGRMIHELRGHEELTPSHFPSMLFACAISPDGHFIATGDKVGHVTVWDLKSGQKLATLDAPQLYTWDPIQRRHSIGGIRSLAFSPDGRHLAAGGSDKILNIDHLDGKARVEVFDWQKGERTCVYASEKFNGLVEFLAFHPHGNWLLAAGGGDRDGFLMLLDAAAKKVVAQEKAPMYVHDAALGDMCDKIYAVGHRKIAVLEITG